MSGDISDFSDRNKCIEVLAQIHFAVVNGKAALADRKQTEKEKKEQEIQSEFERIVMALPKAIKDNFNTGQEAVFVVFSNNANFRLDPLAKKLWYFCEAAELNPVLYYESNNKYKLFIYPNL